MFFLMKKMQLRVGITTIFVIYLDSFKFRAINEVRTGFFVKKGLSAGWVKFVAGALRNTSIMENFGQKCTSFPGK